MNMPKIENDNVMGFAEHSVYLLYLKTYFKTKIVTSTEAREEWKQNKEM